MFQARSRWHIRCPRSRRSSWSPTGLWLCDKGTYNEALMFLKPGVIFLEKLFNGLQIHREEFGARSFFFDPERIKVLMDFIFRPEWSGRGHGIYEVEWTGYMPRQFFDPIIRIASAGGSDLGILHGLAHSNIHVARGGF